MNDAPIYFTLESETVDELKQILYGINLIALFEYKGQGEFTNYKDWGRFLNFLLPKSLRADVDIEKMKEFAGSSPFLELGYWHALGEYYISNSNFYHGCLELKKKYCITLKIYNQFTSLLNLSRLLMRFWL